MFVTLTKRRRVAVVMPIARRPMLLIGYVYSLPTTFVHCSNSARSASAPLSASASSSSSSSFSPPSGTTVWQKLLLSANTQEEVSRVVQAMQEARVAWSFTQALDLFLLIGYVSGDAGSAELLKLVRQGVPTSDSRFLWLLERYAPKMVVLIPTVKTLLGDEYSIVAYETAFTALSITNHLKEARALWAELQKEQMLGSIKITLPVCTAMMSLFVRNNQAQELMTLYHQLSFWKIPPKNTLGHIVAMVCKLNDDQKLKELLKQMEQQAFTLDVSTSDELAIHYFHTNQYSKITELEDQVKSQGIQPGSFIMSWRVYTNIELGQMDKAVDLWQEMQKHNVQPHGILGTYTLLMHHHAKLKEGKWELNLKIPEASACIKKYFLLPEAGGYTNTTPRKHKKSKRKRTPTTISTSE